MKQPILERNLFESFKAKYTVDVPGNIREKLAAWSFAEAEDIDGVIACLERIDCAACYSPAPIFNHEMAAEIARFWPEIDQAMDGYRDATGEAWTLPEQAGVLAYLWFAYEWIAHELACEIRSEFENGQEA